MAKRIEREVNVFDTLDFLKVANELLAPKGVALRLVGGEDGKYRLSVERTKAAKRKRAA